MEYETLAKYDRIYGELRDVCMRLKPSTVQFVDGIGKANTFIVEVMRHEKEGDYVGDYIFVQSIDDKQNVTRLALPPADTKEIAAQLRKLEKRSEQRAKERRSANAKRLADERMARGEKPAFLVKKGEGKTA